MGMFDYVRFSTPCPTCGAELNKFQSKDGVCELDTLNCWEVEEFYDYCSDCKTSVLYTWKKNGNLVKKVSKLND